MVSNVETPPATTYCINPPPSGNQKKVLLKINNNNVVLKIVTKSVFMEWCFSPDPNEINSEQERTDIYILHRYNKDMHLYMKISYIIYGHGILLFQAIQRNNVIIFKCHFLKVFLIFTKSMYTYRVWVLLQNVNHIKLNNLLIIT